MSLDLCENDSYQNKGRVCAKSDGYRHVRFECNGVLNNEQKLEDLLYKILLTSRSCLKRSDNNKLEILIGKPEPYAVAVLDQRNCISRNNTKSLEEVPCGFLVSGVDEEDGYNQNSFYVMMKGENYRDPTKRIENFTIDFVTNKYQLHLLSLFNLVCRNYQLENYNRTVGMFGHTLNLGNTVLLQDDTLLVGTDNGAEVMEIIEDDTCIYGFTTDEPFHYYGKVKADKCVQGCTIIQPSQFGKNRCVTIRFAKPETEYSVNSRLFKMTVGITNVVLFDTPILKDEAFIEDPNNIGEYYYFIPKSGNHIAFGEVSKMNIKAVILSIKPADKSKFEFSLVPYNEDLYFAGRNAPVFNSNMTNISSANDMNFNMAPTVSDLQEKSFEAAFMNAPYEVKGIDWAVFEVDEDNKSKETYDKPFEYTISKGAMLLDATYSDEPKLNEYKIILPKLDIDGVSLTIEEDKPDTVNVHIDKGADLSTIQNIAITFHIMMGL